MISVGLVNIDCWAELCVFYFSWKERRNSFYFGINWVQRVSKIFLLGMGSTFHFFWKMCVHPHFIFSENMCPFWNLQYKSDIDISDELMNIVKDTQNIEPQKVSVELINMCPFWNLPLTTCFIQPQMFLVECSRIWNTRDNQ